MDELNIGDFQLLYNDTGEGIYVSNVGQPTHGIVTYVANVITYTPPIANVSTDSFPYTIKDVHGQTSTANVNIVFEFEQEDEDDDDGGPLG